MVLFTMSTCKRIVLPMLLFALLIYNVQGEDEDDYVMDDILTDLVIGFGMAVCDEYDACRSFMIILGVVSMIIVSTGLCFGTILCGDVFNKRNIRRGITVGSGYTFANIQHD